MLVGIPEATKELMNRELQMFKRYQVEWWEKHQSLFPTIIFLA